MICLEKKNKNQKSPASAAGRTKSRQLLVSVRTQVLASLPASQFKKKKKKSTVPSLVLLTTISHPYRKGGTVILDSALSFLLCRSNVTLRHGSKHLPLVSALRAAGRGTSQLHKGLPWDKVSLLPLSAGRSPCSPLLFLPDIRASLR